MPFIPHRTLPSEKKSDVQSSLYFAGIMSRLYMNHQLNLSEAVVVSMYLWTRSLATNIWKQRHARLKPLGGEGKKWHEENAQVEAEGQKQKELGQKADGTTGVSRGTWKVARGHSLFCSWKGAEMRRCHSDPKRKASSPARCSSTSSLARSCKDKQVKWRVSL